MSLYTERDPAKLREIAVALCVETAKRSSTHTSAQLTRVAEETVPPVPTPEPEYHTYKGVTYRDGHWWYDNYAYVSAAMLVWCVKTLTDDDHAPLLALKENPVKVATVTVEPHKKTPRQLVRSALLDAVVASDAHGSAAGYSEALGRIGDALLSALDTTPATVASEPVAWELHFDGWLYPSFTQSAKSVARWIDVEGRTAVPLYRHPATEAEALAVLVGAGWVEESVEYAITECIENTRVLVAPEGK